MIEIIGKKRFWSFLFVLILIFFLLPMDVHAGPRAGNLGTILDGRLEITYESALSSDNVNSTVAYSNGVLTITARREGSCSEDMTVTMTNVSGDDLPIYFEYEASGTYSSYKIVSKSYSSDSTGRYIGVIKKDSSITVVMTSSSADGAVGTLKLRNFSVNTIYTVEFRRPAEATGSMANQLFVAGETITAPSCSFKWFGYEFQGWALTDGATVPDYPKGSTITGGLSPIGGQTIPLYAVFAKAATTNIVGEETEFRLHGGESAVFQNIPAGTTYQIWEDPLPGWSQTGRTNYSGTIPANTFRRSTFTNTYSPNEITSYLTGEKQYNDGKSSPNGFSFHVEQTEGPNLDDQMPMNVKSNVYGTIPFAAVTFTEKGTYKFTITEDPGENPNPLINYDTHAEYITVTVSDPNENGNLQTDIDIVGSDGVLFKNYSKPGSLTLTKHTQGGNPSGKVFTFRISLTNADGQPLTQADWPKTAPTGENGNTEAITGTLPTTAHLPDGSSVEIVDGLLTVGLKQNETVTISNLPAGSGYSIRETNLPSGWELTGGAADFDGTISANVQKNVVATNTYVIGSVAHGVASIVAHKQLVGETLTSGAFEFELFEVSESDLTVPVGLSPLYTASNGSTDLNEKILDGSSQEVDNPWYGTAPVRFPELDFSTVDTHWYLIREIVDPAIGQVNFDTSLERVKIVVTDQDDGTLLAEVFYDDSTQVSGDADAGPLFVNRMNDGSLKVVKDLRFATTLAQAREFTFHLSFRDRSGTELTDTYPVKVYLSDGDTLVDDTRSVVSGGTVSIKGGEYFIVENLPHGSTYEVTEDAAEGFTRTEVSGGDDPVDGMKASGTITGDEQDQVNYLNYYSTLGSANPVVFKDYQGGLIQPRQFKFELRETRDGPAIETAYANTEGKVNFLKLDFDYRADGQTFEYYVVEIPNENEADIMFDERVLHLDITVNDNGYGELSTTVVYDEGASDNGVFTNYRIFDLTIAKTVSGNMGNREMDFPFSIRFYWKDSGEAYTPASVPSAWTKIAEGKYSFVLGDGDSFQVRLPQNVYYEVAENPSDHRSKVTIRCIDGTGIVDNELRAPSARAMMDSAYGNQTVTFENTRNMIIPTKASFAPLAMLILIPAVLGLAFMGIIRKRKKKEE